jgi:hypothetical protein
MHDGFGSVQHARWKTQLFAKICSNFWVGRIQKLSERHHGKEREKKKRAKQRVQRNMVMMIDVQGFNDADVETTKEWENPLAASSPIVPRRPLLHTHGAINR